MRTTTMTTTSLKLTAEKRHTRQPPKLTTNTAPRPTVSFSPISLPIVADLFALTGFVEDELEPTGFEE